MIRALKLQIQAAAVEAARRFYEVDREETGHGRCGGCEACQLSMENMAALFKKAMEREVVALFLKEHGKVEGFVGTDTTNNNTVAKDQLN